MTISSQIAQRLSSNDLAGALGLATDAVRRTPQAADLRLLLVDLLILSQDWERADRQAGLGASLSPKDAVGWSILRGEIGGMHARAAWYEAGAVPSFPDGPTPADEAAMRLALAVRDADAAGIARGREALDNVYDLPAMRWNGAAPGPVRDLDDLVPHALEVVTTGGAYLWVGFDRIASLRFAPVRRPRDLAFRPAALELHGGSSAQVLVPVLYHAREPVCDALALGRETRWVEGPGGVVTGRGQRCLLVGDDVHAIGETMSMEGIAAAVTVGADA